MQLWWLNPQGPHFFRIGYRTFFEIRLGTSTEDQGQFGHLGVCQLVILILSAKPIDSSHTKVVIVFFLSCVDLSQLLTPYTSCQLKELKGDPGTDCV